MKNMRRNALLAVVAIFAAAGCSNMSERDKRTAIGAGVGGVAGSVLTDQSTLGTVGGAAVGGYIGRQSAK